MGGSGHILEMETATNSTDTATAFTPADINEVYALHYRVAAERRNGRRWADIAGSHGISRAEAIMVAHTPEPYAERLGFHPAAGVPLLQTA